VQTARVESDRLRSGLAEREEEDFDDINEELIWELGGHALAQQRRPVHNRRECKFILRKPWQEQQWVEKRSALRAVARRSANTEFLDVFLACGSRAASREVLAQQVPLLIFVASWGALDVQRALRCLARTK